MPVSIPEFASKIRAKYPGKYDHVPDTLLAQRTVEKNPIYAGKVDLGAGGPRTQEPTTSIGAPPIAQTERLLADIRSQHPGKYDYLDDMQLVEALQSKHPEEMRQYDVEEFKKRAAPLPGKETFSALFPSSAQAAQQIEEAGPLRAELTPGEEGELPILTSKGIPEDQTGALRGLSFVQDISSMGERMLGATFNQDTGRSFMEELADPNASITKKFKKALESSDMPTIVKVIGDIGLSVVSDPTIIGGAATKAAKPLAKGAKAVIKKAPLGESALKLAGEAKKLKPSDLAAKLGEEMTSIDREVLKKYSTKAGRKELEEAYGKQADIGDELVSYIDNFDDKIPEGQVVRIIVKDMKPIPLKPVVTRLKRVKIQNPIGKDKTVNKKIDELIADVEKMGPELPGKQFRKLRQKLDAQVSWEDPAKEGLDKALASARKQLASQLIIAAKKSGNPQYVKIMKDYAKKLQVRDRVQKMLGKTGQTSEERAEGFVSNLMSMNKTNKRKTLEELDNLTGSDFMKRIKATAEAKQIGIPDKEVLDVPWLPKVQTGAKWFGLTGVGSPALVSKAIIPILRGAEKGSLTALKSAVEVGEKTGKFTAATKIIGGLSSVEKVKLEKLALAYDKNPKPKFKQAIMMILNKTESKNGHKPYPGSKAQGRK